MKKIVSIMGARSNPKGEAWTLGGVPLMVWPYTASKLSGYLGQTNTFVSSNSDKLKDLMSYPMYPYQPTNYIDRPDRFATSTATDLEWISHALKWMREDGINPDILVHLRASTPLIDPKVIDEAISLFLQVPEATSMRSAHPLNESPYKMFTKDGMYWKPFMQGEGEFFNQPRQKFATVYHPNGYVDILRSSVIDSGVLHGDHIMAFETAPVIEIDRWEDVVQLEYQVKQSVLYNKIYPILH